jgi:hypothetical protein
VEWIGNPPASNEKEGSANRDGRPGIERVAACDRICNVPEVLIGQGTRRPESKLSGHVPYDLRHTFAATLLTKGTPLTYVTEQMGHKKPITTFLYCAH